MFLEGVLYPITDPDEWAINYHLEILEVPCMNCDNPLLLTRPFATKELRGLTSFPCTYCDEKRTPFVFTFK